MQNANRHWPRKDHITENGLQFSQATEISKEAVHHIDTAQSFP